MSDMNNKVELLREKEYPMLKGMYKPIFLVF